MSAIPVHAAVTIVVEHENRFLMTEEVRDGEAVWYFPSGALEPGESPEDAARREVLEETGYCVQPCGVIRVNFGVFKSRPGLFWWRYVIAASAREDNPVPVAEPEILSVEWIALERLDNLRLRNADAGMLARMAGFHDGLDLSSVILAVDGRLDGFIADRADC